MFFDDPKNALSVARTHQRELLQKEQLDRLAREARLWQTVVPDRFVVVFRWTALLRRKSTSVPEGACPSTGCSPSAPPLMRERASQGSFAPGVEP
jgi:hypothetical protein